MTVKFEEIYKIIDQVDNVSGINIRLGSGDIVSDDIDNKVYKFYWGTVNDKEVSPRMGYRPIPKLGRFGSLGGCLITDYNQAANYAKYIGMVLNLPPLVVEFTIPDKFYFNEDEYKAFIRANTPSFIRQIYDKECPFSLWNLYLSWSYIPAILITNMILLET